MTRSTGDLVVVCACAGAAGMLAVLTPDIPVLRLAFGLPLVLFLPGYALAAALFARQSIGLPEWILFSVGLSLVVAIVGGLLLGSLHWQLQTGTWAILLVGVTLSASVVARIRRRGNVATSPQFSLNLEAREGLLLGLAVLATLGALGLARTPTPARDVEGYTLLWIQSANNGDPDAVRLGVSSMEFIPVKYNLQVIVDDQIAQEWPTIQLAPGEKWETTAAVPGRSSSISVVEALLYRLDAPDVVYRRVTLRRGP